jgi:hypothetical protein
LMILHEIADFSIEHEPSLTKTYFVVLCMKLFTMRQSGAWRTIRRNS